MSKIDVNIDNAHGWDVYQGFVNSGRLPRESDPGTSNPKHADTTDFAKTGGFNLDLGPLSVGMSGATETGKIEDTHLPNGRTHREFTYHLGDNGMVYDGVRDADWHEHNAHYKLLLDGVDDDSVKGFLQIRGQDPETVDSDQDMRVEFDNASLKRLREEAVNTLAGETHGEMDASEVADSLRDDPSGNLPNVITAVGPNAFYTALAAAKQPGDVFDAIFMHSARGSSGAIDLLTSLQLRQYDSEGNILPSPAHAPDRTLPGEVDSSGLKPSD